MEEAFGRTRDTCAAGGWALSGDERRASPSSSQSSFPSCTPGRVHHAALSHPSSAWWPRPPQNRYPLPPRESLVAPRPTSSAGWFLLTPLRSLSYDSPLARAVVLAPSSTSTPSSPRALRRRPRRVASRRASSTARTRRRRPCSSPSLASSVLGTPLTTRVRCLTIRCCSVTHNILLCDVFVIVLYSAPQ